MAAEKKRVKVIPHKLAKLYAHYLMTQGGTISTGDTGDLLDVMQETTIYGNWQSAMRVSSYISDLNDKHEQASKGWGVIDKNNNPDYKGENESNDFTTDD